MILPARTRQGQRRSGRACRSDRDASDGHAALTTDASRATAALAPPSDEDRGTLRRRWPGSHGWRPSAMPLIRALSQITLIVRGIPAERCVNRRDGFAAEDVRGLAAGRANPARHVGAVSARSNGSSSHRSATRCFNCRRFGSSSRAPSCGCPARTSGSSLADGVSMFARRRTSSSSSTLRLCASSITSAVISPACVAFAKEPLEPLEEERLRLA